MPEPKKPFQPVNIACEVCLKEVPQSEAQSNEANDYVLFFCGLECYDKWRHQSRQDEEESSDLSR